MKMRITEKPHFTQIHDKLDLFNEIGYMNSEREEKFNRYISKSSIDPENLKILQNTLSRMARFVHATYLDSLDGGTVGRELIAKANQYKIPFNKNPVDFLELSSEVDQYEILLKKADDFNIDWDKDYYDPIGLEQEIEEKEELDRNELRELRWDYYASTL